MNAELVVMAAGMGSRFGGLKQAAPIGPNGEMIIDLSVHDAKKAGFNKAIFIIRKEIEEDFRTACGKRIENVCLPDQLCRCDFAAAGFMAAGAQADSAQ